VGAGADIGQHGQRCHSWLQEKARRRWSLLQTRARRRSRQDVQIIPDYKRHAGTRHADSSHQTPGGGSGAAGAAAIKDLLLLRRDKDSIDYDMSDFLHNDHPTMHSTYYAAAASPPPTDMPQAAGGKGKEPLTSHQSPHPNAPTDTDMTSAKTRQVTKADDMTIVTLDSSMPSTPDTQMLTTEAPALRRRGPKTKPKSGHHRQSAKNNGARAPSHKYSTTPRNGNPVNGNHLGICLSSPQKNGN